MYGQWKESMFELPAFTSEGLLPAGDYPLTLDQLEESIVVLGPSEPKICPHWDAHWRHQLVTNLRPLAGQLWEVGIDEIYIDGSFVEDKDHPNDIDGYFACDAIQIASGELERELNKLDTYRSWTWDHTKRRPYKGYPKLQLPMWHAHRIELYPHFMGSIAGVDTHGNSLEFPAYFRTCRRTGKQKGIVTLVQS